MSKKVLFVALAAVGLSSAALANVNSVATTPSAYVGVQAGYGDTNWGDLDYSNKAITVPFIGTGTISQNTKDTGFAGRLFAGYDFNQYIAVEGGYTYFPNTKITQTVTVNNSSASNSTTLKTYGLDLVGRINVPVADGFGLYAKAGPGYLHTSVDDSNIKATSKNVDLVFGGGVDYQINQHLVADVSYTQFNGNHKVDNSNYQPNANLYAVGLAYKFGV